MHLVDALEITPSAQGIYTLGPDGYIFDEYYAGVYNEYESAKVLTFTFETARINTEENTDELFYEVLEYFRLLTEIPENLNTGKQISVRVYPNPVSDIITFFNSMGETSDIKLSIFDITGRQVYYKDYGLKQSGSYKTEISVKEHNLATGVYSYSFKINNQPFTGKIIIK